MESTPFFVTRLLQVPIIIGLPWIRYHQVNINLTRTRTRLSFNPIPSLPLLISSKATPEATLEPSRRKVRTANYRKPSVEDSEEEEDFKPLTSTEAPTLLIDEPPAPRAPFRPSQQPLDSLCSLEATAYTSSAPEPTPLENTLDVYIIGAAPFDLLSRKPGVEYFAASIYDIEKALVTKKV